MTDPVQEPNDEQKEFACNTMLIKALVQFIPVADRKKTHDWLKKLQEVSDPAEYKIRNEYAFYLVTTLQIGNLTAPFNNPPPPGKLKPLCRILPDYLYEDVTRLLKLSYCRLNKMLNLNTDNYEMPDLRVDPEFFQHQQPRPLKGVRAMCAAFSNYQDTNDNV